MSQEEFASENSERIFKDWAKYWDVVKFDKSESMVGVTNGTKIDWEADKATGSLNADSQNVQQDNGDNAKRRWVFAMRHGERVDFTFGQWVPHCFDDNGQYTRKDLNMPVALPERAGGKESYAKDTPLTRFGQLQAQLVGEGLRLAGISIEHVYSSPALRCVQTAQAFLEGLQADPSVKIRVEPGVFEFKEWHAAKGLAPFMTVEELHKAGFNVDLNYTPYVQVDVSTPESLEEFASRTNKAMQSAVKDTEEKGGNLIFVAHGCALDMMVCALKQLGDDRGKCPAYKIRPDILFRVSYCSIAAMKSNPWEVVAPPCPPSMNSSSGRFDWKMLSDLWKNI